MTSTAQEQTSRRKARERRLEEVRRRRIEMDADRVARDQRIDEAAADVAEAWESRADAEVAIAVAEEAAAGAVARLLDEKLSQADVAALVGLDKATVARLRRATEQSGDMGGAATGGAA